MTHTRKLYRSRKGEQVSGVCAGLAEYFGVDVTWVRVAFVLVTLINGIGLLLYIILALVIPKEPLGSETEASSAEQTLREGAANLKERAGELGERMREGTGPHLLGWMLVGLGGWFLLQTLGLISWDAWGWLWQLWPLALIVGGLSVLLQGNRQRLPILLAVFLVGGGLLTAFYNRPAAQGSLETIAEPLQGAPSGEVVLSSGVGKLEVWALENSANLIEGRVQLLPGERLEREVRREAEGLRVKLEAKGNTRGWNVNRRLEGWRLGLSPRVPIRLRVSTGVGESRLNLSRLRLSELTVNTGVGSTQVELPVQGSYRASIDGGVGEIEVRVPREMALRLRADAGLGGVKVPDGLIKQGDNRYESPGYASATNRVDLEVSGGVGAIQVRR
jgi:phage shock protein PspC (stress-responsive transcriptional regulator)